MLNMMQMWNLLGSTGEFISIKTDGLVFETAFRHNLFESSFPKRFMASVDANQWLEQKIKQYSAIIFHSTWSLINLQLSKIATRNNVPYAVVAHGSLDPFDLQKNAILKKVFGPLVIKPYLQHARMIICATKREADHLQTYSAQPEVRVLPRVVLPLEITEDRDSIRKRYEIEADEFLVLILGRIDYKKGFPVLIPAFQKLLDSGIRSRLLIAGPDSNGYSSKLHALIDKHKIRKNVLLLDEIIGSQKTSLMAAVDCFVLPSLNENFGNVVVEAIQVGTPVVISENVYIADLIKSANAGIVTRYDSDEFFEAIRFVALNPRRRGEMAASAIELGKRFLHGNLRGDYNDIHNTLISCAH